jgi:hypothetical protein
MKLLAGFLFLGGTMAIAAAPLDDKTQAFEEAIRADDARATETVSSHPNDDKLALERLHEAVGKPGSNGFAETTVLQLVGAHPSDKIRQLGTDLIRALETDLQARTEAITARAKATLAKVPFALKKAKTAADLDGLLQELRSFQHSDSDEDSPYFNGNDLPSDLQVQVNGAFSYLTFWQDYLAANAAGKTDDAHNALRRLLEDRGACVSAPLPSPCLARWRVT